MTETPHHRTLPTSDSVKLEAIGRLLRQALRLAEGADASGHGHSDAPASSSPSSAATAPPPPPPPATDLQPPRSGDAAPRPPPGGPAGGPTQVGYLLGLLQSEQARLEEIKKEVARKDTELSLKLQFSKKKEEDLEAREGDLKKLEAQIRIRETQLSRREEKLREMGRTGGSSE